MRAARGVALAWGRNPSPLERVGADLVPGTGAGAPWWGASPAFMAHHAARPFLGEISTRAWVDVGDDVRLR